MGSAPSLPRLRVAALGVAVGVISGFAASGRVDHAGPLGSPALRLITGLPALFYIFALLASALLLLATRVWWTGIVTFVVWLPIEDMARKFSGNDLRLYFLKYVLLIAALVGLAPRLAGAWGAVGRARGLTFGVLCVALAMSIPAALIDPRLPLIGLTVRFLFILLFPVGVYLGRDGDRLRSTLIVLCAVCLPICALGVVQSVVGPKFLNPTIIDSSLSHLVVYRGAFDQSVLRPAGPFVDSGRFASLTTVGVVFGLSLVRLAKTKRQRTFGWLSTGLSAVAAFASGGRAALVVALAFVAFALFGERRRSLGRGTVVVIAIVVGVGAIGLSASASRAFGSRVEFFRTTLSPTGPGSELGGRVSGYFFGAGKGIAAGGLTGQGTGTQSIGRQYLGESAPAAKSESGWGTVATEWGPLGLAVWVAWAVAWGRRAVRTSRRARGTDAGPMLSTATMFIVYCLTFLFSLGAQFFDNYVTNGSFWLLSGIVFGSAAAAGSPQIAEYESRHESAHVV
jgi:hypothetical protein